jgi:hypothetical protein
MSKVEIKLPFKNPADVSFAIKQGVWDIAGTGPMGMGKNIDKMFIWPTTDTIKKFGEAIKVLVATNVTASIIEEKERLRWPSNDDMKRVSGKLNNIRYEFGELVELPLSTAKILFNEAATKSTQPTGVYVTK